MTNLLIQQIEKKQIKSEVPNIRAGYTVKVFQKIKEGEKERIQVYEGLVIAVNHGFGASKTMIVRKMVEGIGVEKIFPINSPNISKIEVVRIGKVRQSKLFYMRDISGKAARLKEIMVGGHGKKNMKAQADAAEAKASTKAEDKAPETETAEATTTESTEQSNLGI